MKYTALVSDSRKVVPGCLFFCKGKQFKKEYLEAAAEKGGKVIVRSISNDIRSVFMMTGFLNLFEIQ